MVAVLVVAALIGLLVVRSDGCPPNSVLHAPAGTCINPRGLVVTGSSEDVANAVAPYGGRILHSPFGDVHYVRLSAADLDELDGIKDALEALGYEVRYALVGELS